MSQKKAYFIGIGGIGMSALAQLMADHGWHVTGSDREASPTTELLEKKNIGVVIGQTPENVPTDAELVVYTEAAWEDNPERMRAKELGLRQISYFEGLGEVAKGKRLIAVAGTHGKTTTTAMLAKVLADAGASPSAVVGSIVKDFMSNYLSGTSDWLVVEACEYKRDFLTLMPEVLVITNIEYDHTDYYNDLADVQAAFRTLAEQTTGVVIANTSDSVVGPVVTGLALPVIDYKTEASYTLRLPGDFNQMNARAAAAAARHVLPSITEDSIATSLAHFHGTWRRFDYKGKTKNGADVYDDYAHHPTAIAKTLAEARKMTEGKVYLAFHPHLYSRTKDLFDGFSTSFKGADKVLIAPIYAAREVDDGTVSNATLAQAVNEAGVDASAADFAHIKEYFETAPVEGDIVMTIGAGDIYKVADELTAH